MASGKRIEVPSALAFKLQRDLEVLRDALTEMALTLDELAFILAQVDGSGSEREMAERLIEQAKYGRK
ncbi:MAG: hypothetical protein WCK83_09140 [Burkholderiales bacterium]